MKRLILFLIPLIFIFSFSVINISCTHSQSLNTTGNLAIFETSMGTFQVKLFPDKAPKTVARIKELISKHFYDGIIFHRVIDGFVIQGGDPTGTGTGGSGQTIPDEFNNGLSHYKEGIVAMAHSSLKNSGDSQFYITLAPQMHLDGKYTIFGEVVYGMNVVHKIAKVETGQNDKPLKDVKMISVTLEDE
jgi:cyclophilin family peptidyl-prolyl cis-trans isomerase